MTEGCLSHLHGTSPSHMKGMAGEQLEIWVNNQESLATQQERGDSYMKVNGQTFDVPTWEQKLSSSRGHSFCSFFTVRSSKQVASLIYRKTPS